MSISVVNITKASSTSVTIPSTTAGNCLLVLIASRNGSGAASVSGITLGGSAGNFASLVAAHGTDGFIDWCDAFAWEDPDCAGGQTAVAISGSNLTLSSGQGGVTILEISGLGNSPVLDQSHTGTGVSTSFASGTTGTTTAAAELWAAVAATIGGATGPGSPWTDESPAGGAAAIAYQVTSSTGTASYSGSCSNEAWGALVVALKQGTTPVSGSDAGSGADSSSITATLPTTADTGSGADVAVIDQPGTETGSGADSGSLTASVPGAEAGTGTDVATVSVASSDTGSGADSGSATFGALGLDTGSGSESAAITAATIATADTGSGAESSSITATLPAAADTGTGADVATVGVTSSDTGSGAEAATQAPYVPPPIVLWNAPDKLSKTGGTIG